MSMGQTFWYISFAAEGRGFLGGTVVEAEDTPSALAEATKRGLNPGGEAAILPIPAEVASNPDCQAMLNRLVGLEEMKAQGGKRLGDCEEDVQEMFDSMATRVCEECSKP